MPAETPNEIPPPRDIPKGHLRFELAMPPEEFEEARLKFIADLARVLNIAPDDINIVEIRQAEGKEELSSRMA